MTDLEVVRQGILVLLLHYILRTINRRNTTHCMHGGSFDSTS
jgi:hypothetical protein